ncbi:Rep [uncultured virus]|uniref:Rep n=1 Tax=uncultured virus TaxID=340016 RepID=A0A2K9LSC8_9VIRU|nr:Rep [uncultured virus]
MSNMSVTHSEPVEPSGNTKSTRPKYQAKRWCFTIPEKLYPTSQKLGEYLKTFCEKFNFQKEKGEKTDYLHYQGCLHLKQKEYFATVKNLLGNATHLEPCIDWFAAVQYCSKKETRVEGPFNEKSVFIKTIVNLRDWQQDVIDIIRTEPDDRTVHWYYDVIGNMGKSQLCKYLHVNFNATIVGNGAFKDIAYALPEHPEIVCFAFTREIEEKVNYSAIEAVKDGMIFSGKFESKTKVFNSPHVLVFANFAPRLDAISEDRWHIVNIRLLYAKKTIEDYFIRASRERNPGDRGVPL